MNYDVIIIGAGLYGLYSAELIGRIRGGEFGKRILVLERDAAPFMRATYINQARVHMGYHYPRSYSTAIKSRNYFERFVEDYGFCIKDDFKKIYATSTNFSWTNTKEFKKFCIDTNIKCMETNPLEYFNAGMCDGVFETQEYTYDAKLLLEYLYNKIRTYKNVEIKYNAFIDTIVQDDEKYVITLKDGSKFETEFILNTTYASVNQIINKLGFQPLKIKYELCEIILCDTNGALKDVGITVMDGPFFSIMPFGKTGLHSLTSVTFTPHITSYNDLPTFQCQKQCDSNFCSSEFLGNCNECDFKPQTAYPYMSRLAKKYLNKQYSNFTYNSSLFSMKPILQASEIDDSRPTIIKIFSEKPKFISVLSGKINTVYDLDEVIL